MEGGQGAGEGKGVVADGGRGLRGTASFVGTVQNQDAAMPMFGGHHSLTMACFCWDGPASES